MNMLKTIIITNDPSLASDAEAAGVDRIMVDLESIGKKERQASRTTFISSHSQKDIAIIRDVLTKAELIVRINPWHEGSRQEIETAIADGADFIMLPMITDMDNFNDFASAVANRAGILPLVETKYSMDHIADIAAHPQVIEVYIGLNDLHLSLGMDFLFEPLAAGLIDKMADIIHTQNKPFGFGGIAAIGGGELPAEYILAEHVRLGSSCVILSSRFGKDIDIENADDRKERIKQALDLFHEHYQTLSARSKEEKNADFLRTQNIINELAQKLQKQRKNQA